MHYLIDGYNLIFRSASSKSSLQKRRETLIKELNILIGELKLNVTVVFDAPAGEWHDLNRGHVHALEVVYTAKKQSADEYILQEITHCHNSSLITVVTSDRSLANLCKAQGAHVKSIESFLTWVCHKKEKKKVKKSEPIRERAFKDSETNIARLLLIFEKKLLEDLSQDLEK